MRSSGRGTIRDGNAAMIAMIGHFTRGCSRLLYQDLHDSILKPGIALLRIM